ncbi:MAG: DNA primase noncatalytic subunit PriX [Candidatus Nitrosopolaris sp.]
MILDLFRKEIEFKNIQGYDDIKDIVKRALDAEDNYNLLFIGPPASAKTLFLLGIIEYKKGVYFDGSNTTNRILQWTEQFLTNNKADSCHSNSLSFKNCMARVPGSFNSKLAGLNEKGEIVNIPESAEVKIMQEWNGVRPSIKPLLSDFYIYLADSKIKEIHKSRKPRKYSVHYGTNYNKIGWIETLLQIPIPDHRKYALWRIIVPYLVNVRKLSHDDAVSIIREWLDMSDKLKPLVGVNDRIKANLTAAARVRYLPISFSDLKTENRQLANIISCGRDHTLSIATHTKATLLS